MVDIIAQPIKTYTKEELLYEPKVRASWSIGNSVSAIKQRNVTWKIGLVHIDSDSLEVGDCVFLALARSKCDLLIAAIPTDMSLRVQKKKFKFTSQERAFALGSLTSIDYIVPYEEDSPALALSAVNPDIIFSGRVNNEDLKWTALAGVKIEDIVHPFRDRKMLNNGKYFNV